jgi:hypothetical protein
VNAGELLYIKVRPVDPVTAEIIKDATGVAYLFAPPKDPQDNPGDRTPDHTVALAYDTTSGYYLGTQDSTGFAPGTWWCQGKVTGGAGGVLAWSYQAFPLNP